MIARLACLVGRHRWQRYHNAELGDAGPPYLVCRRCGKDKPQYQDPGSGQATGMGVLGNGGG